MIVDGTWPRSKEHLNLIDLPGPCSLDRVVLQHVDDATVRMELHPCCEFPPMTLTVDRSELCLLANVITAVAQSS